MNDFLHIFVEPWTAESLGTFWPILVEGALVSLALGVVIVSLRGSNVDLLRVLFGTVLSLDDASAREAMGRRARQLAADPSTVAAMDLVGFLLRLVVWTAVLLLLGVRDAQQNNALIAGSRRPAVTVSTVCSRRLRSGSHPVSVRCSTPWSGCAGWPWSGRPGSRRAPAAAPLSRRRSTCSPPQPWNDHRL